MLKGNSLEKYKHSPYSLFLISLHLTGLSPLLAARLLWEVTCVWSLLLAPSGVWDMPLYRVPGGTPHLLTHVLFCHVPQGSVLVLFCISQGSVLFLHWFWAHSYSPVIKYHTGSRGDPGLDLQLLVSSPRMSSRPWHSLYPTLGLSPSAPSLLLTCVSRPLTMPGASSCPSPSLPPLHPQWVLRFFSSLRTLPTNWLHALPSFPTPWYRW